MYLLYHQRAINEHISSWVFINSLSNLIGFHWDGYNSTVACSHSLLSSETTVRSVNMFRDHIVSKETIALLVL